MKKFDFREKIVSYEGLMQKKEIIKTPKIYFLDTGMRNYTL